MFLIISIHRTKLILGKLQVIIWFCDIVVRNWSRKKIKRRNISDRVLSVMARIFMRLRLPQDWLLGVSWFSGTLRQVFLLLVYLNDAAVVCILRVSDIIDDAFVYVPNHNCFGEFTQTLVAQVFRLCFLLPFVLAWQMLFKFNQVFAFTIVFFFILWLLLSFCCRISQIM